MTTVAWDPAGAVIVFPILNSVIIPPEELPGAPGGPGGPAGPASPFSPLLP